MLLRREHAGRRPGTGGAPGDHSITVRDPDQIARLKQVYASAKWTPFIDTWPADLVSIAGMQGDEELFSLAFGAGSMLIERVGEKGPLRKSTLDEASANWLQELTRDPQWHD